MERGGPTKETPAKPLLSNGSSSIVAAAFIKVIKQSNNNSQENERQREREKRERERGTAGRKDE